MILYPLEGSVEGPKMKQKSSKFFAKIVQGDHEVADDFRTRRPQGPEDGPGIRIAMQALGGLTRMELDDLSSRQPVGIEVGQQDRVCEPE